MAGDRGFVMRNERGRNYPAMVCETCGEIIDDYLMAGVVWGKDNKEGSRSRVTVLCKKNGCLSKEPYRGLPWQEMSHYALWLLYNSGLKTEKQVREDWERAEMMGGM
jgi:hypothetical protein